MAYRVKEFGEGVIMLLMPKLGELYAREETFMEYAKNYNEWIQTKEKKVMFFDIWVGMVATNQLEKEGTVKAIPKEEQISYEEALAYVQKKKKQDDKEKILLFQHQPFLHTVFFQIGLDVVTQDRIIQRELLFHREF